MSSLRREVSMAAPYIPMPMNDGDRHAATNVDFSASEAVWPACIAAWKCDVRIELACAARGSDDVSAMTVDTNSAIAASGFALDHALAPGWLALGLASIVSAATCAHTFSSPAR